MCTVTNAVQIPVRFLLLFKSHVLSRHRHPSHSPGLLRPTLAHAQRKPGTSLKAEGQWSQRHLMTFVSPPRGLNGPGASVAPKPLTLQNPPPASLKPPPHTSPQGPDGGPQLRVSAPAPSAHPALSGPQAPRPPRPSPSEPRCPPTHSGDICLSPCLWCPQLPGPRCHMWLLWPHTLTLTHSTFTERLLCAQRGGGTH